VEETMTDFTKDIILGVLLIGGVLSFISGQFVISTMVFASAALLSNISMQPKLTEQEQD
jgi:hypothetical protein